MRVKKLNYRHGIGVRVRAKAEQIIAAGVHPGSARRVFRNRKPQSPAAAAPGTDFENSGCPMALTSPLIEFEKNRGKSAIFRVVC
jgi:hypothetical protein